MKKRSSTILIASLLCAISSLAQADTQKSIKEKFEYLKLLASSQYDDFYKIESLSAKIIEDIQSEEGFLGKSLREVETLLGSSHKCNSTHVFDEGELCSAYFTFKFDERSLQVLVNEDGLIIKTKLVNT